MLLKNNNKVNFLKHFFLIMRNKPPNSNIPRPCLGMYTADCNPEVYVREKAAHA